jgi:Flp pilus assembly protein TadG
MSHRPIELASFRRDERGAIAVIAAMVAFAVVAVTGAAVDAGRWFSARQAVSSAVDAAVLAGARTLQLSPDDTEAATLAARTVYRSNMTARGEIVRDTIAFAVAGDRKSVVATGEARLPTTFLQVAGIPDLPLAGPAGAEIARATIAVGGSGGSNIEVALMLDVTGSMCDDRIGPCTTDYKLTGLKDAAKSLVDIVVSDDQSTYTSRVALVPFSTRIRVAPDRAGGDLMRSLTGLPPTWSGYMNQCVESTGSGASETGGNWQCTRAEVVQWSPEPIMPCVTDRFYNGSGFDATDAPPGAGAWLNAHDGSRMTVGPDSSSTTATAFLGQSAADPAAHWNYGSWGCADVAEANEVLTLTSDKSSLARRIDGLQAYGSTSGALGTSWAWYMLSPRWAGVLRSNARPYADLSARQPSGAPLLRKVAVIMTDGGFNTVRGWKDQDQQTVSNYAIQVCTAMKAKGIEVFTVGFALDKLTATEAGIARATLRACGSDVTHFYETLSVPQLEAAFRDIALQLSSIRLTQ